MGEVNQLTIDEQAIVKELCQVLKPVEKVTKTISGNYLTASLVIALTNGLFLAYRNFSDKHFPECVKSLVIRLNMSLDERSGNLKNSNTLSMATFLDPRFKIIAFKDKKMHRKVFD